jgi:hypothetical protein
LTLNDPDSDISGQVLHAINIRADVPGGHTTMQDAAKLAMSLAYVLPPGADSSLDSDAVRFMNAQFENQGMTNWRLCLPGASSREVGCAQ